MPNNETTVMQRQPTPDMPEKTETQPLSLPSHSRILIPAIQRLCSMKNQTQLTPHAAETWVAVLSVFDPRDVNCAVLEIGLSTDPFPDLGKVVALCDTKRRARAGTQLRTDSNGRPGRKLVEQVAEVLSLDI